ncbi:hypothetical protein [Desulfovibrio oxyclinae]|uniref:hypothetical protein n=1 Tax=Desulfovibrio oxyclinae TaxID=63560 RepID=UPI0003A8CE2A|nr:hypothetical protein [Desulfovibrio oxyclinae]
MDTGKPYFDENGDLVIPFECAEHEYKYWKKEGRELHDILQELGASREVWERYTWEAFPENESGTE